MSDTAAVLFANDAFYTAFATGDFPAMHDVWADRPGIGCLHPGWPPLIGRDRVMQSWRRILSNPQQQPVAVHGATAEIYGDVAIVICYETTGGFSLIATNVFVLEGKLWKLVHHQSGETQPLPDDIREEAPTRMQ